MTEVVRVTNRRTHPKKVFQASLCGKLAASGVLDSDVDTLAKSERSANQESRFVQPETTA